MLHKLCIIDFEIKILEENEGFLVSIKSKPLDSKFLIGQYGINLAALQHLLRIIIRKQARDRITFAVDVDNYRKNRLEYLKNIADNSTEKAKRENKLVVLEPMTPGDRRIIHIELAKDDEITSESIGEGETRRISIKPVRR